MNYGMNIDELVNCTLLCIIVQIRSKLDFRKKFQAWLPVVTSFSVFSNQLVELVDLSQIVSMYSQCARKSLGTIIFMTAVGTWRERQTIQKRTKSSENRRESDRLQTCRDLWRPATTAENTRGK